MTEHANRAQYYMGRAHFLNQTLGSPKQGRLPSTEAKNLYTRAIMAGAGKHWVEWEFFMDAYQVWALKTNGLDLKSIKDHYVKVHEGIIEMLDLRNEREVLSEVLLFREEVIPTFYERFDDDQLAAPTRTIELSFGRSGSLDRYFPGSSDWRWSAPQCIKMTISGEVGAVKQARDTIQGALDNYSAACNKLFIEEYPEGIFRTFD